MLAAKGAVVGALRVTMPLVAVSVRLEPVEVAGVDSTKVVPLVMDATVAPVGMPSPLMAMPGTSAAVLATTTVVFSLMVVAPVSAVVVVLKSVTTVPAVILVPLTAMPAVMPEMLVTTMS